MEKYCYNHPAKEAVGICHSCGRNFCEDCLNEGTEYYFCNKPQCRAIYESDMLPEVVRCPECLEEVMLGENERIFKKFNCSHCGKYIDWATNTLPGEPPIEYMYWGESLNVGDIALMQSILDEAGIDYYIEGSNFIALGPLVQPAKLHIRKDQQNIVKELLKDFEFHIFGTSNASYNDSEED